MESESNEVSEYYTRFYERIDFQSLGFSFAIDNIEPRIGKIEATHVSFSGIVGVERKYTPIDLKVCDTLQLTNLPLTNEY